MLSQAILRFQLLLTKTGCSCSWGSSLRHSCCCQFGDSLNTDRARFLNLSFLNETQFIQHGVLDGSFLQIKVTNSQNFTLVYTFLASSHSSLSTSYLVINQYPIFYGLNYYFLSCTNQSACSVIYRFDLGSSHFNSKGCELASSHYKGYGTCGSSQGTRHRR